MISRTDAGSFIFLFVFAAVAGVASITATETLEAAGAITKRQVLIDVNGNQKRDAGDVPLSYTNVTLMGMASNGNEHFAKPLETQQTDFSGTVRFRRHASDGQSLMVNGHVCESTGRTLLCSSSYDRRAVRQGTVYFIYFIPNDREYVPEIGGRIWDLAELTQENFRNYVGSTFPIYFETLVIRGDRDQNFYSESPDNYHSRCEFYYLGNVWTEIKEKIGGVDWDPNHRYVIYHDIDICEPATHFAAANLGTAQMPAPATATEHLFSSIGAMVTNHELGHAFTLSHTTTTLDNCMYPAVQEVFPCLFSASQVEDMLTANPGFWSTGGVDNELPNGSGPRPPETTPRVFIAGATVNEGAGDAFIKLLLSESTTDEVSVTAFTRSVTAEGQGIDYTGVTEVVTFAPGDRVQWVRVTLMDDQIPEDTEIFEVNLTDPNGVIPDDEVAIVEVLDDDVPSGSLYIVPMEAAENTVGPVRVNIQLSTPSNELVSFQVRTNDDTTSAGVDYFGRMDALSIPPGETSATFDLWLIDDNQREGEETLTFQILQPVNAAVIGDGISTLTILDDE